MLVSRAAGRPIEERIRSDCADVLNAMGMAKADPSSRIGSVNFRCGIVITPPLSKLCSKPKRSRMTRTEYSTELQAGMSKTFGTS